MTNIRFYDTRTVITPSGSFMILDYYLLKTISRSSIFYGIKVCSKASSNPSHPHWEQVSHLTNSMEDISTLLKLCADYFVTPTDLFTALDTLMNSHF